MFNYLEVRRERVRQPHVLREGTEYQVPHLDAVRWNDVTETEVVVAQKLREVVQQDKKNSQRALKK